MTRLTFDTGLTTDPTISPDGKLLAYASDRGNNTGTLHLWIQQLKPDGQAVQLTQGEWDDHQPVFSPDGSTLAFRSDRGGGGIYIMPTLGGQARMLVNKGQDPRYSPDGQTIAYWEPTMMWAPFYASSGKVFTVDLASRATRCLASDMFEAGMPEWSPDGQSLIVHGRQKKGVPWLADWDWWVIGKEGGNSVATGALPALKAEGFEYALRWPRVAGWKESELLFTGQRGDSVNIWSVGFSRAEKRLLGKPRRLTSTGGHDLCPVFAGGRLLFASLSVASDVWMLPVDTERAVVQGERKRATDSMGPHTSASLSLDGRLLAFNSLRYGRERATIRDLQSGRETTMGDGSGEEIVDGFSRNGSFLVYTSGKEFASEKSSGYLAPVDGGTAELLCRPCATVYDLSADNRYVLYTRGRDLEVYDRRSRENKTLLASTDFVAYQHHYAPDGRFLAFERGRHPRSDLVIAPLRSPFEIAPEREWVRVSGGESWADKPRWSPNGKWLYYLSNRDGFFCLWAQQLDEKSKRPVNAPVAILHLHHTRYAIGNAGAAGRVELSVARDKVAFNLGELTGNIWSVDNVE